MPGVAYDPYNTVQNRFLSALALPESGGGLKGLFIGTGGKDLKDAPTDEYGFPQWTGYGNSHAAGWFQFQPGTWKPYAEKYNLNFRNPDDQKAGAWYLAQDEYAKDTGRDLQTDLASGDYSRLEQSLANQWVSVPGKLSTLLNKGEGADIDTRGDISMNTTPFPGNIVTGLFPGIQNEFARWGLLIIGAVIILIALWQLLSQTGLAPAPAETAKTVAKVATVLV